MSWQFTNGNLIWGFLQLDDLLINKLALLVDDKVGIQWTFWRGIVGDSGSGTLPGQGNSCEAAEDRNGLLVLTVPALDLEFGRLG